MVEGSIGEVTISSESILSLHDIRPLIFLFCLNRATILVRYRNIEHRFSKNGMRGIIGIAMHKRYMHLQCQSIVSNAYSSDHT